MGIFGKKKKGEEEPLDEDLEAVEENKVKRKLKDLNPENKKKRKEPPKPWGKKERLIVLTAFLVTIFAAVFLTLRADNPDLLKGLGDYKNKFTDAFKNFRSDTIDLGN